MPVKFFSHDRLPTLPDERRRNATELLTTARQWLEFCKQHDPLVGGVDVAVLTHSAGDELGIGDEARDVERTLVPVLEWVRVLLDQFFQTRFEEVARKMGEPTS